MDFFLVNLDIREESTKHSHVIKTLVKNLNKKDYDSLSEDEKVDLLTRILDSKDTYSNQYELLPDEQKLVVDVFKTMILLREQVSKEAFLEYYIISMTHDASHVLEVMVLAKMAGLLGRTDDGRLFCDILITPFLKQ